MSSHIGSSQSPGEVFHFADRKAKAQRDEGAWCR